MAGRATQFPADDGTLANIEILAFLEEQNAEIGYLSQFQRGEDACGAAANDDDVVFVPHVLAQGEILNRRL